MATWRGLGITSAPVDAVVLGRGATSARVRLLSTGEEFVIRSPDLWHVMPGHVATFMLSRRWRHRAQWCALGELREVRIDVPALGLPPLLLHERKPLLVAGIGADEPAELRHLRARIAAVSVPRMAHEMEQVLPWSGHHGGDHDPILESIARKQRGDAAGAAKLLVDLLRKDLRCIDAHAHLGNLAFPSYPEHALLHYEIGVAIGEHALGSSDVAMPWSYLDNRPFLRCLHGQGLSLWRLGRMEDATRTFERLLWLDPMDGQGATHCWRNVNAGRRWDDKPA